MTAAVVAIRINIDPELNLPNSPAAAGRSPPLRLKGRYLAFPEQGSHQTAYKLHEADDQWHPGPTAIGTVMLNFGPNGSVQIS